MSDSPVVQVQAGEKAVVVSVLKRMLDGASVNKLRDEVNAAAAASPGLPLVLDLSKVEFAPSVALGTLVNVAQDLKWSGRRLILCGMTRQVRGTFAVTRLDKVFEAHPTLADALASLGAS